MLDSLISGRIDVAISVNGGDRDARDLADKLSYALIQRGLQVFYYRSEEEAQALIGANLETRLREVYAEGARLVIPIFSPNYGVSGYTKREWNWIKERGGQTEEKGALLPIAVSEGELSTVIKTYAYQPWGGDIRAIIRLVMARLGYWSLVKTLLLFAVSAALSVGLYWRYHVGLAFVGPIAESLVWVTILLTVAWWFLFFVLPRVIPKAIFQARHSMRGLRSILFRNPGTERLTYVAVIAVGIVAIVVLPGLQDRIERFRTAWIERSDPESALRFFCDDIEPDLLLEVWLPILSDSKQGGAARGRALDVLYRCLKGWSDAQAALAPAFVRLANAPFIKTDPENIQNLLVGVDLSQAPTLAGVDLRGLSFVGPDYPLGDTDFTSSLASGSWFYTYDVTGSDLRWSDFSNATFVGLSAKEAHFASSNLEGVHFLAGDFSGASFFGANLTGAHFLESNLQNVDFTNAELVGVTFENCDLTGAIFVDPSVKWVGRWGRLSGVRFLGNRLDEVDFSGASFADGTLEFWRRASNELQLRPCAVYSAVSRDENAQPPLASVPVPGAVVYGGSLVDTNLADIDPTGLVISQELESSLSQDQRNSLSSAGFSRTQIADSTSIARIAEERAWERIRRDTLDRLFAEAGSMIPRLCGESKDSSVELREDNM